MKARFGSLWMALGILATALTCAPGALGEDAPSGDESAKAAVTDAKAQDVMKRVAAFYSGIDMMTVDATLTVTETSGAEKTSQESVTVIALDRPDKISVISKSSDDDVTGICDGTNVYIYRPADKKYMVESQPENPAEVVTIAGKGPGQLAALIMAEVFRANPYEMLMKDVTEQIYVGEETLDGQKCDHVKYVHPVLDVEMWVSVGEKAIVNKVTVDPARLLDKQGTTDTKIDMTVVYRNWVFGGPIPEATFTFTPPEGVKKLEPPAPAPAPDDLLGKPAPAFKLDLLGGGSLDLAAHKDKNIVILDFWATWCGPCRQVLPVYAAVAEAYKDKGVVFYAVNEGEEAAKVKEYMDKAEFKCTVALDTDGEAGNLYGVSSIPMSVIVDKNGTIQAIHLGSGEDLEKEVKEELDTLISGKKLAE